MTEKKYYITGGAGFIGRHVNKRLDPSNVINIDFRNDIFVPNQVNGNIRDKSDIEKSIGNSNTILHLAASHYDFEKDYYQTNVVGTKNLLEVATEKGIKDFIFYSSVAVYGSSLHSEDEESTPKPENPYGATKLEAESLIKTWAGESKERRVVIIRPAVVFGPHNYGNLFNLTRQVDLGRNMQIGNKSVIKSIAYVENLVDATFYLMENLDRFGDCSIFNYADEPHIPNHQISAEIGKVLGKSQRYKIPYTLALTAGLIFDILGKISGKPTPISAYRVRKFCSPTHFIASKIKEVGFEPRFDTIEGLVKTTEWFDNNRPIWNEELELLKKHFKHRYQISLE